MAKKSIILIAAVTLIVTALGIFSNTGKKLLGSPLAQFWSWNQKTAKDNCQLKPKPREFSHQPYYTGQLIDAHIHMPVSSSIVSAVGKRIGFKNMLAFGGTLTLDYLACLFKSEGISQTIGFFMTTRFSTWQELTAVKKATKNYPGRIAPFFMPAPYSILRVKPSDVRNTLDKNKGLFKGIGEIKVFDGTSLDNPYFMEMFKIASDYNLIIMMHPFQDHRPTVEKILKQHPKVKFLLHGGKDAEWIMEVMKDYKNLYYSLDADIVSLYGWERGHARKEPTKEEWLNYIRKNFDSVLNEQLRDWKPKIEAYSDRFMWGTDRWYAWHFDYEVGGLLEEFGRSFIGKLSPSVQEKFAHKNAEMLIEKR